MTEQFNWPVHFHEVDYATFSHEDNKLRIYSDRVSVDLYAAFKAAGWQRAHLQGCFFATWRPGREDIALALCGEIGDEDTTVEDRAEDKAERLAGYSENAGKRATAAHKQSHNLVKHIPLGQPLQPPGHHSRKGHLRTLERSRNAMDRAVAESGKSTYWAGRSADTLAHAARKNKPGAILRRIKKLEAARRKSTRARAVSSNDTRYYQEQWLDANVPQDPDGDYLGVRARLGLLDAEQSSVIQKHLNTMSINRRCYQDRWIAHYTSQIDYWQAVYDAGEGNTRPDFDAIIKGGWVKCRWGWGPIKRLNKRDGKLLSVTLDKTKMSEPLPWSSLVVQLDGILEYSATDPRVVLPKRMKKVRKS